MTNRRTQFIHQISIEDLLFVLVFVIGTFIRFWQYGNFSMTNDELSLLNRISTMQMGDVLKTSAADGHPPGLHFFMYYWLHWFGDGPWAVRLPFVIFSSLSLLMIYLLAARWFNKVTALFTVTAFALLAFPILYGELCRPYSPGLFFSLLAAWFWTRIVLDGSVAWPHLLVWVIAATLSMYCHYFSWLAVAIMGLSGLVFLPRQYYLHYILSGVAIVILYIPGLTVFFHHLGVGGLDWLGKPTQDFPMQFLLFVFNDSALLLYVFVIISFMLLFWSRKRVEWKRTHTLAVVWALLPFTIAYIKSQFGKPVLQEPVLLFSLPYLLMFAFSFYQRKKGRTPSHIGWYSAYGIWALLLLVTLFTKAHFFTDRLGRFGNFKNLTTQLGTWQDQYSKQGITFATAVNAPYYIEYYPKHTGRSIAFVQYINDNDSCMKVLEKKVSASTGQYFAYSWCHTGHPTGVEDMIQKYYANTVEDKQFSHYGYTLFQRKAAPAPAADSLSHP